MSTARAGTSATRRLSISGLAVGLAATAVVVTRTEAQADSPGPVLSGVVSGVTDDRVVVKTRPGQASTFTTFRLDFTQGAATAWHHHTGPGLVTVVDGSFVLTWADGDDCHEVRYSKGDAFVDPGDGTLHRLLATAPGAVTATFVTPAGQPATVPATTAPDC